MAQGLSWRKETGSTEGGVWWPAPRTATPLLPPRSGAVRRSLGPWAEASPGRQRCLLSLMRAVTCPHLRPFSWRPSSPGHPSVQHLPTQRTPQDLLLGIQWRPGAWEEVAGPGGAWEWSGPTRAQPLLPWLQSSSGGACVHRTQGLHRRAGFPPIQGLEASEPAQQSLVGVLETAMKLANQEEGPEDEEEEAPRKVRRQGLHGGGEQQGGRVSGVPVPTSGPGQAILLTEPQSPR